jgi:small subunit ribosomal protein S24e
MVNITILEEKENKLFHRKEISFEIEHLGSGTPNRIEVKEKLAAMKTAKPELTFIKTMKPRFGSPYVHGSATIYDDEESAKIEPKYVKIRNIPKAERDEAWKAEKAKKKKKKKKKN